MRWFVVFLCMTASAAFAAGQQRSRDAGVQRSAPASNEAVSAARDVSDKAQDLWNAARREARSHSVDLHMSIGAFAGAALALSDNPDAHRTESVGREAVRRLLQIAGDVDRGIGQGSRTLGDLWRAVQENLVRLSNAYDLGYYGAGGGRRQWQRSSSASGGVFRWRGRVDGSDHITLRGDRVSIQHISYNPIRDDSYDLSQPLPARTLDLRLTKIRGRGRVELVNRPSSWNNYSATVLVEDPEGGDDIYEFELAW